jgi:hypothetical protein
MADDTTGRETLLDPSITTETKTIYSRRYYRAQKLREGLKSYRSSFEKEKGEAEQAQTELTERTERFKQKHNPYFTPGYTAYKRKYPVRTQKKVAKSFTKGAQEIEQKRLTAVTEVKQAEQAQAEYNKRVAAYNKAAAKATKTTLTTTYKTTTTPGETKTYKTYSLEGAPYTSIHGATMIAPTPQPTLYTPADPQRLQQIRTKQAELPRETFGQKVAYSISSFAVSKYNPQRALYMDRTQAGLEQRKRQIYAAVPKTKGQAAVEVALWTAPGIALRVGAKGYRAYQLAYKARVTQKVIQATGRGIAAERAIKGAYKAKAVRSTLLETTTKDRVIKTTIPAYMRKTRTGVTYIKEHPRYYKMPREDIKITTESGYNYFIPKSVKAKKAPKQFPDQTALQFRQKITLRGGYTSGEQYYRLEKIRKIQATKKVRAAPQVFGVGLPTPVSVEGYKTLKVGQPTLRIKAPTALPDIRGMWGYQPYRTATKTETAAEQARRLGIRQASVSKAKQISKSQSRFKFDPGLTTKTYLTPITTLRPPITIPKTTQISTQGLKSVGRSDYTFKTPGQKFKLPPIKTTLKMPPLALPPKKAKKRRKPKRRKYTKKPRKYAYKPSIIGTTRAAVKGRAPKQKRYTGFEIREVFK